MFPIRSSDQIVSFFNFGYKIFKYKKEFLELVFVLNYLAPTQDPFTHLLGTKSDILGRPWQWTLGVSQLWTSPAKQKKQHRSLRHGAFMDSQSIPWIFAAVAEQVSRIMAPEEESVKTFDSLINWLHERQTSAVARQDALILTSCLCLSVWHLSKTPSHWRRLLWRKPGPRAWRRLPSAPRTGLSASPWGRRLGRRSYQLWENDTKSSITRSCGTGNKPWCERDNSCTLDRNDINGWVGGVHKARSLSDVYK